LYNKYENGLWKYLEKEFKKFACQESIVESIIYDLVRICFREHIAHSNWILSHFQDIKELKLIDNLIINNSTIMKMTNLKKLYLKNSIISTRGIKYLTSIVSIH
jgi:hypothetical protein